MTVELSCLRCHAGFVLTGDRPLAPEPPPHRLAARVEGPGRPRFTNTGPWCQPPSAITDP